MVYLFNMTEYLPTKYGYNLSKTGLWLIYVIPPAI